MNKSSRILITGVTGLVGSYVARLLAEQGYVNLIGTKRTTSKTSLLGPLQDQIEWKEGDLTDPIFLYELCSDCEIIIHCAAHISYRRKDYDQMMNLNSIATQLLVNYAMEHQVKHFIYVSSIAALGRTGESETIDESRIWRRNAYNSDYAVSKYLGEMEVWRGQAEGLQTAIVNPSIILGAGFWGNGSLTIYDRIWKGVRFYPPGASGWVDVRDVAKAILKIAEQNITNQRFILNGSNESYYHVFHGLASEMKRQLPKYEVGTLMAEIGWRASHLLSTITGQPPYLDRIVARITQNDYVFDNRKSIAQIGLKYRDLASTIKESARVYLDARKQNLDYGILPFQNFENPA